MQKSDRDDALILIGVGIIIGAAFIFIALRKQQAAVQTPAPAPQQTPQATQIASTHRQDTEFIKWYTETIIKPSIESAARESVEKAIRQFMEANPRAEVQTLGPKTARPRAKTGNWMIIRDSEGAIMSIETVKDTPQKETKPSISLTSSDKINTWKEHIS